MPNIPTPTLVIAADKGFEHARDLGLEVDVVVGDFDSVAPQHVETLDPRVILERHSVDKDDSDLTLALRFANRVGAHHIDIITGGNGRLDHLLIGALLIANSENLGRSIVTHCGSSRLVALGPGQSLGLENLTGCWISLISLKAETRVRTEGLKWNLALTDSFPPFSSLGLSNQVVDVPSVEVNQGSLLAIISSPDE
tara:strand:- start:17 stop:607 length:591 start_codon:yes stop_codon:yes gene_type:complete